MAERDRLLRTMVIASLALLIVAASFALAQEADGDAAAKSAKKDDGIEKRAKDAEEAILAEEEQPKGFLGYLEALWDRLYKLGGRVMIFLAAAAIIGLASILERALSLLMAAGSVRRQAREPRPVTPIRFSVGTASLATCTSAKPALSPVKRLLSWPGSRSSRLRKPPVMQTTDRSRRERWPPLAL